MERTLIAINTETCKTFTICSNFNRSMFNKLEQINNINSLDEDFKITNVDRSEFNRNILEDNIILDEDIKEYVIRQLGTSNFELRLIDSDII